MKAQAYVCRASTLAPQSEPFLSKMFINCLEIIPSSNQVPAPQTPEDQADQPIKQVGCAEELCVCVSARACTEHVP